MSRGLDLNAPFSSLMMEVSASRTERHARRYKRAVEYASSSIPEARKTANLLDDLVSLGGLDADNSNAKALRELSDIIESLVDQKVSWQILAKYLYRLDIQLNRVFD